ncbi:MAG: pseudouridine synthase, partial [Bacteroidetes bacterium]|nr:pseudouridine synthase [Bacteroidota bacterium]
GADSRPPRKPYTRDGDNRPRRREDDNRVGADSRPPRKPYTRDDDNRPRRREDDNRVGADSRPPRKPYTRDGDDRPRRREDDGRVGAASRPPRKPYTRDGDDRPHRREDDNRVGADSRPPGKPYNRDGDDRPRRREDDGRVGADSRPPRRPYTRDSGGYKGSGRGTGKGPKRPAPGSPGADGLIRLNKYIANAGMCSRREADDLIVSGAVKVNGEIVNILGTRISPDDKVQVGDQTLTRETLRYVLVNKPKGYITTMDDPEGRKTIMFLVREACRERIYPVGRLDRETTGVLLLTNDGEMTKKLTHPSHGIRKVYHVVLDKPLAYEDLKEIENGIELEDGFIKVDAIAFTGDGKDKRQLGLELHSGKNRIVRRIFEQLGYTITRLDRVVFAGLTKKDLPRGRWRILTSDEVNFLKML